MNDKVRRKNKWSKNKRTQQEKMLAKQRKIQKNRGFVPV